MGYLLPIFTFIEARQRAYDEVPIGRPPQIIANIQNYEAATVLPSCVVENLPFSITRLVVIKLHTN